jgi:hypothetical protein
LDKEKVNQDGIALSWTVVSLNHLRGPHWNIHRFLAHKLWLCRL